MGGDLPAWTDLSAKGIFVDYENGYTRFVNAQRRLRVRIGVRVNCRVSFRRLRYQGKRLQLGWLIVRVCFIVRSTVVMFVLDNY